MSTPGFLSASTKGSKLICVVDSDPYTCETLSVMFQLEGFQTNVSTSIPDAVATMQSARPDAVIVNINIGDENGLTLLRHMQTKHYGAPVIMLVGTGNVDAAVRAMKFGAFDVVTKPIDHELLLQAVLAALRKNTHIDVENGWNRNGELRRFPQLTAREQQVLQLIVNGLSNKETGVHLNISPRTVEVHRARVMEKLSAKNTADLMRIVLDS